jgi:flavin reductase (DIM6/NTAB) family NADH-FMN oxidoreductase RutF
MSSSLKEALGAFPTGVTVITVRDPEGRPHGMTANAFSSVSIDPPLILICVNQSSHTHGLISESGRFGVNILSEPAEPISRHCARPGADKVLQRDWLVEDDTCAPHLLDAAGYLDCEVAERYEAGTHTIFIGRVLDVVARPHAPLLYYRGRYHKLAS